MCPPCLLLWSGRGTLRGQTCLSSLSKSCLYRDRSSFIFVHRGRDTVGREDRPGIVSRGCGFCDNGLLKKFLVRHTSLLKKKNIVKFVQLDHRKRNVVVRKRLVQVRPPDTHGIYRYLIIVHTISSRFCVKLLTLNYVKILCF